MQSLYYIPASQSLELHDGGSNSTLLQTWSNISSVAVIASEYEISGSDFGSTLGSLRIYAYSGSISVASFPIDSTNLYYPPFPTPNYTSTPTIPPTSSASLRIYAYSGSISVASFPISLPYTFTVPTTFTDAQLQGSGCSITSASLIFVSESYYSNSGTTTLTSGSSYLVNVYGSGSHYFTALTINDITYGTNVVDISNINDSSSYTFTPEAFHSYQATFAIVDLSDF